jgi:hypothetical protein
MYMRQLTANLFLAASASMHVSRPQSRVYPNILMSGNIKGGDAEQSGPTRAMIFLQVNLIE